MNHSETNEIDEERHDDAVIATAFRRSLIIIGAVLAPIIGAVLYSLSKEDVDETIIAETQVPSARVAVEDAIPKIPLVDVTQEWGVDFAHESGRAGEKLLPETMGSGVAVFDANSDGHQDLLFVNSNRWPWNTDSESSDEATTKLYLNDGAGHFTDATAGSGLDISMYGMGVAVGDIDNDGDRDVYLSGVGLNRMFRNDTLDPTQPKFTDITADAGVAGDASDWGTSCGFFDYDNDGLLDLFVCNYVTWTREMDLAQSFTLDGQSRAYGPPRAFSGSFPLLFHNDGDGKFTDLSKKSGIQIKSPDTNVPLGKSMGVVFADINTDGRMDIVVANDTVPNFLFENNGDGTFKEVGRFAGIAFDRSGNARGAMGIDCAYLRNDDTLAIGIGNFANEPSALYLSRASTRQFIDAAMFTGFGPPTRQGLTFGLAFVDLDLDGRLDVIGANGHLEEDIARTQATQQYAQSPQAFWNAGTDSSSELVLLDGESVGTSFQTPIVGRGAAHGDFDGDGDQDLVISISHGLAKLFRNDQSTGHAAIRVRLVGNPELPGGCNRDAIGAIATLKIGDKTLRRCVSSTSSYLSQSELELTFGLGMSFDDIPPNQPLQLTVQWPGGESEVHSLEPLAKLQVVLQGENSL